MKQIENPILPEHRVLFKEYLKVWQEKLSLTDWRINLSPKKAPGDNTADVMCYAKDRMARVRLGTDAGSLPVTPELLESYAVHELLHVMLHPLQHEELEDEALQAAEHGVIHVLQKLLTKSVI